MTLNDVSSPRVCLSALLALAASLGSGVAFAAETAPSSGESPTRPAASFDHPASVLDQFARGAYHSRITAAWWTIGGGAVFATTGLLSVSSGEHDVGDHVLWIGGTLWVVEGIANLFLPSDLEMLDRQSGGGTPGYTPDALDVAWKAKAEQARTLRHVSGITSLTLGAGSLTAGALLAGGVGDLSGSDRTAWSIASFVAGGAVTLAGVVTLLRPSDMEKGYHLAFPNPSVRADVALAPVPGGGTLQLFGTF